ncbi:MAG TPA: acetylglutamate kinase, partial [Fodinibius sp.]|nr:acetylglutamate kinase [Fodinibius sp.]
KPALDVAVMVYAGLINKNIVAKLQASGCNALGLSGADLNIIPAQKRKHPTIDYGYVGDISADTLDAYFLSRLLEEQAVLVFSAITHDQKGQLLNTNADTIASVLATAMSSRYPCRLTYCFEKNGVLEDKDDDHSWIQEIDRQKYADLKEQKIISDGMIPKLDTAFEALAEGVEAVHIKHASKLTRNTGTKLSL